MIFTIIVIVFSLIVLMAIHEMGHFLLAKKFGVKVPEFGIGYPPRIWGKKIGETFYSINWLPFGAFVKIIGEDGGNKEEGSFGAKPIWQRALILAGGVIMFWLVAIIILSFIATTSGVPTSVKDNFKIEAAAVKVIISDVLSGSPADEAGIKIGDVVKDFNRMTQLQEFVKENLGQEISLNLLRGAEEINILLSPRAEFPKSEGAMGVSLVRVVNLKTVWYKAPVVATQITFRQTKAIPVILFKALKDKIRGERVVGVQFVGPVGVGKIMGQALEQGIGNFLVLVAMIAIWLALFNSLPIPALDGGRLLFLAIEAIRRKPMNQKIEHGLNGTFLIILMLFIAIISIKDIIGLF